MSEEIQVERSLQGIATVIISNPGKRNALTVAMWRQLQEAFGHLGEDADLRCVLIRGAGGQGFAAGADISEFDTVRGTRAQVEHFHEEIVFGALSAIYRCPMPVIALIEGACVGGGLEIASVCDIRIANRSALLGIPVSVLGFPLAPLEMQWLFRLAGPAVVAELTLEGRILNAEEALVRGLLTRVVDDHAIADAAYRSASAIARAAPLAVRANKLQLRRLLEADPLSRAERLEIYAFADTMDYREGVRAFRNKTEPIFQGC